MATYKAEQMSKKCRASFTLECESDAEFEAAVGTPQNGWCYYNTVRKVMRRYLDGNYLDETSVGMLKIIEIPFDNNPTVIHSDEDIPAGEVVNDCDIIISVSFGIGPTITVGSDQTANLLQLTSDNTPLLPGYYPKRQRTPWTVTGKVKVTVGGSPAVGSGFALVRYAIPKA